jgi:alkanesulfonate monooxygenase SsuD/methylene tetrahydromethanopterin reductase-like flavin-dependent oxidoreductase (luciferase family)
MPAQFGLALFCGPNKGHHVDTYLQDLDYALPRLEPYVDGLWMTDHFFWGDEPTHEAWTVLAYLAARYPGNDIGPMVLGQSYRNPALTAKMAATLQHLSGGRFVMGIGAGWKEDEYHAYGYDYPTPGTRIAQLEDTIEIMRRLWTQPGPVTYQGKYYQIVDAYCEPKPHPVPPLIVGGGGDKTLMLAARFADWWNMPDAPPERYAERLEVLKRHCESIGRDYASIRKTWFGRLAVAPTEAQAEALSGGKWTRDRALCGDVARVIAQIEAYKALGVTYFMCEVQGQTDAATLKLLRDEVLPALAR